MIIHPISDGYIAENWPDMDNPDGREEIRRQFDILMAQVRIRATYPFPRHPEAMAPVIVEKARKLPERLEILKAALAGLPPHWKQWQWLADEKPAFGDRFVRSNINGDNGHGFGRQWIACVNHVSKQYVGTLADLIAAANPDTLTMMITRIEELEASTPAPQAHTRPIEDAPAEGFFLAETRDGDWIKAERYDNPFGDKDTVISRRSGIWWSPTRWMPLPATTEGQP